MLVPQPKCNGAPGSRRCVLLTNGRSVNQQAIRKKCIQYIRFYYLTHMEDYPLYWPQFYTATILEWKPLLKPDKYKDVIIDSLKFIVKEKWVEVNGFCIMSNHIHLIWQIQSGF